jgi:hypothetical protein
MLVEELDQPPHPDAIAPVAPGMIDYVGLRLAWIELRAQPFPEREKLEVHRDVDREARAVRPLVPRAADNRGIGVPIMRSEHCSVSP